MKLSNKRLRFQAKIMPKKPKSDDYMNNFFITTLGCRVNQYESEAIAQSLKKAGWAYSAQNARLCIINTCTVTHKAFAQSKRAIRGAIRANPQAIIVATGCASQIESNEIGNIEGVHYIIGNAGKHKIPEMAGHLIKKIPSNPEYISHDINNERYFQQMPETAIGDRTRPILKIQDGCDAFCTYCIVPYARGRSRSMPIENVLHKIKRIKEARRFEVALSGIHLGRYGLDLSPQTSLIALLRRIHKDNFIDRVRLSSIEPCELTNEIVEIVAKSDIFCRHFHISLQSGDDNILKRMHRPYTSLLFKKLVANINKTIPDAAIGADILIGFPGETQEAFENTYYLIEKLPITYLHVFPFSARKKTAANKFTDKTPQKVIENRCRKMRQLSELKKNKFYKKFIGRKIEALVEGKRDKTTTLLKGVSSNYIPVLLSGKDHLKNTIINVVIEKVDSANQVFGNVC